MKYRLLLIILTLISCKSEPKKPVELRVNSNEIEIHESTKPEKEIECALSELKKTTDYKNELKKYAEINGDTLIEIEKKKIGINNYRTVFEISAFEQNLWLLIEKETETDSILIQHEDYVECIFVVESEFDLDKCQIRKTDTKYSMSGETEKTEIKTIKL
ncbi:MAG: hypothetical protein J5I47_11445 [Vicingus serpentipes]|nr:hypothetical protein [Vicingus serpentipes]